MDPTTYTIPKLILKPVSLLILDDFPYNFCFTYLQSMYFAQTKVTFYPFLLTTSRIRTNNKAVEWAMAKSGRLFETIDTAKVL